MVDSFQMEVILDHYRNPRNFGKMENPDITHEEGNISCGDLIRVDLKIKDNIIEDIKFSGKGCTISQASASIMTEIVKGKNLEEVKKIDKTDLLKAIGVPISMIRMKCALLGLKVLKVGVYGIKTWPGEEE